MSCRRHVLPGPVSILTAILVSVLILTPAWPARAGIEVVVTSKPVHALVAQVMQGVGRPALLVDGAASPHTFAMRPSDAHKVNRASVFFRVSEGLEPFTARLVKSLPKSVGVVTLAEARGVKLLQRRSGGSFDAHSHAPGQGSSRHGGAHKDHAHGAGDDYDAHIWLDPDNAKAIVAAVGEVLSQRSPADAARFAANAAAVTRRIDAMTVSITAELAPVSGRPFIVLHDAYQYFERRFGLAAIGSIAVSPEEQPSARRITELRRKVSELPAVCVFAEPHHQTRVVTSVTEGTRARTAVLDPEGTTLEAGPELYFVLMQRLAAAMRECLAASA